MIEKIRAAFEAKFPRPKGAVVDADGFYSGAEWVSFYNARWEAWQAAHAAPPAAEQQDTVAVPLWVAESILDDANSSYPAAHDKLCDLLRKS